jgi:NADH-quinone oxidoreductase subunit A
VVEAYAPLILYGLVLCAIAGGLLGLTALVPRVLGIRRPTAVKTEPYECGVPEIVPGARGRFSVRFYLVAILFILFDIETVFLIPWAVTYRTLGLAAFVEVVSFLGVLVAAYVYVWKRGALEWE